ncbi:MAG: hypothetical protein LBE74_01280 [Treponema sp.]|jgi:hypothetical protein|nr:hypothetical protein [Treponema sp.]
MMRKNLFYAVSAIFAVFFCGCSYYQPEEGKVIVPPVKGLASTEDTLDITGVNFPEQTLLVSAGERRKIDFGTDSGKTIRLDGLSANAVYLVKVNRSGAAVKAQDTGGRVRVDGERSAIAPAEDIEDYGIEFVLNNGSFIRTDHRPSQEFNRNPPTLSPRSFVSAPVASLAQVGDVKQFWVQDKNDNWIRINAALRATADHSNVWVAVDNFADSSRFSNDNKITTKQAQNIADKFDAIYGKETALFGYEFGGGLQPTDANYGGKDGDVKIQILVYDIDYDYSRYQTNGTFGYFWGKDHYDEAGYYSNLAEMFYIDAYFTDAALEGIYSTMVHEFQHMINFNEKQLKKGKLSTTWFDEMLSQLAEDVIGPFIGIDVKSADHPVNVRISYFLASYWKRGFTEWLNADFEESMISYANAYAFGAYLVRNFGGAALIKDVMENDYSNIDAIDAALEKRGFSFEEALAQYGEALVFADDAHGSFNKTVTTTVNGIDYSFTGFDIWDIKNYSAGQYYGGKFAYPARGPVVIDVGFISAMGPYSIFVQSCADWKNASDALSFELKKPENSAIDFYIIVK